MPVDAFLRYRQGDLIPQKFKLFRLRGFFNRIRSQDICVENRAEKVEDNLMIFRDKALIPVLELLNSDS